MTVLKKLLRLACTTHLCLHVNVYSVYNRMHNQEHKINKEEQGKQDCQGQPQGRARYLMSKQHYDNVLMQDENVCGLRMSVNVPFFASLRCINRKRLFVSVKWQIANSNKTLCCRRRTRNCLISQVSELKLYSLTDKPLPVILNLEWWARVLGSIFSKKGNDQKKII